MKLERLNLDIGYRDPGFEYREVFGWSRRWAYRTQIIFEGTVEGDFRQSFFWLKL